MTVQTAVSVPWRQPSDIYLTSCVHLKISGRPLSSTFIFETCNQDFS